MYTQLFTKSVYTLLRSSLQIDQYIRKAKDYGIKALALTDEENVYGLIKFYQTCIKYNIKPLLGISIKIEKIPIILLAKNNQGYKNILRIASLVKLYDIVTFKELIDFKEDLVCIVSTNDLDKNKVEYLKLLFYDNLYLSIFPEISETIKFNNYKICELSKTLKIEVVCLNEVKYLTEEDAETLRYLEAIDKGEKLVTNEMQLFTTNNYLLEPDKFFSYFKHYQGAINNTNEIADMCNVEIDFSSIHLPKYQTPQNVSSNEYLKALCKIGLEKRLQTKNIPLNYYERLKYELTVIENMHYSDYFLIVYDFVKYAKNNNIYVGPGRGSAAGSLVSYVLGITNVDPIKYDLLFERFLNPERVSLPDIDLDFQDDRREEVIKYVQEKYGKYNVSHILAFGTFQSRSAIREIGKVMGIKDYRINEIISYIDSRLNISDNIVQNKELQKIITDYKDIHKLLNIAQKIEDIPRNTTTHAAGIIICEEDLRDLTGLQKGLDDIYQTQFEAKDLEAIGLIKMDFLGIRNLTAISQIVDLINKNHKTKIDINRITLNDDRTYRLIARGETSGIFQLESKGMRSLLIEMNVKAFEDIVAANALFRPGPMDNIPLYIARKNKKQRVEYLHPDLIPILENTYGIIVYQEQIMMIVQKIAGYSLGEADILRRAIGKKEKEVIENERARFISRAIDKGYDKATSEKLYEYIIRFGDYGFNRSHSVCYALISYQMAYLKANYILEFMVVMLSSVLGSENQTSKYIRDCKRYGISILPISINKSYNNYGIENNSSIRVALLVIKGIGKTISDSLIEERKKGPFKNFIDFVFRCNKFLKQNVFETLVFSGALDEFNLTKKTMIENYQKIIDFYRFNSSGYFTDQISLDNLEEYSVSELMSYEIKTLGFYLHTHPVQKYLENNKNVITPSQTLKYIDKSIEVVGYVENIKKTTTKNNEEMATILISDDITSIYGVIFPKIYQKLMGNLENNILVKIKCKVQERNQKLQLVIFDINKVNN